MKIRAYICFLFAIVITSIIACHKDDNEPDDFSRYAIDTTRVYVNDNYENRLKDSVWYYFKYLSLWEKVLPPNTADLEKMDSVDYLKNHFTQYFQSSGDIIGYLKYLTKASVVGNSVQSNQGSGNYFSFYQDILYNHKKGESRAYDWYSYLDRGGFVSGTILKGFISGYGMDLEYLQFENNLANSGLFIRFVEKSSSAYTAGLRRGDKIISLNGDTKIDFDTQKAQNFNTLTNYLNSSNKLTVEYRNTAGIVKTVQVEYKYNGFADPIFIDTLFQVVGKKVAYMGLSSFVSTDAYVIDNGEGKYFDSRIREVFEKFSSQGATDLVVDLRYNGGGSVLTAEYLADYIVPSSASGKLMYTNKINAILKSFEWDKEGDIFGPVNFAKKGNLNLSSVYFLVSPETASASEMLINVLSPYMKVYLIGTYSLENKSTIANNTYGKPVGFFPVDIISANNQLYVISFQMFNKNGYGDYFDGLKPNTHVWEYQTFEDFGQQDESMLASALEHIKTGIFKGTQARSVTGQSNFAKKVSTIDFGRRKIQGMYKFPTQKIHF